MNDQTRLSEQESKQFHISEEFFHVANDAAALAERLNAVIKKFNDVVSVPNKFPTLESNPLYPVVREIMNMAADARIGTCKVACDQGCRAVMNQMLADEAGSFL